jgi:acyl-CoA thioester hydrolase
MVPDAQAAPHIWPVRVYFEDTDAGGVVYYANYLKFAERARTEMLRAAGFDHTRLAREFGAQVVVRRGVIDFVRPARLDDALEVRSRIANMAGASFTIRQDVFLSDAGNRTEALLVALEVRLACVSLDMRAKRLPAALREALGLQASEGAESHRKAI